LKVAEWGGKAPTGALGKPEDAIGRGVVEPIVEGEPVVESRLAARGAGAGLAAIIPPGMRAVAVRVNDVVGVAGFLSPGMKVDVLIAGNPPNQSAQALGTQTKTLLQNIEVLSAGQNIQKDAEGKPVSVPVVNMLVTPEQAEILSLASNETRIQLVLRNPTDKEVSKTKGTSIANLFGAPEAPAKPAWKPVVAKKVVAPPPPPPMPVTEKVVIPITVEVIHGSTKKDLKFKNEDEKDKKTSPESKP
jgi:pilus assembly protein CpaB